MSNTERPKRFEFGEGFYKEHTRRVNTMIDKLSVTALYSPLAKEVHRELIDFAIWFDRMFEEPEDPEAEVAE